MARYMLLADIFGVNKGEIVEDYRGYDFGLTQMDEIATGEVHKKVKAPLGCSVSFFSVPESVLSELSEIEDSK